MRLIVRPEGIRHRSRIDWYEDQEPGLGAEFIRSVDVCLGLVEREPHAFPVIYRNARRALLRRFPYGVFYLI